MFKKIVGNGENTGIQRFILFQQCFLPYERHIKWFGYNLSSANVSNCHLVKGLPITKRQILDASKRKEFADDNFKFDENGRKLSKRVENTVGKGEIARYEQFLLFPVFSKGLFPRSVKRCHCVGIG